MGEATIPVDILNPGQVFACLGFMEVADLLCRDAEGSFDGADDGNVRFRLRAAGDDNPFERVLDFLATAEVVPYIPETSAIGGLSKEDKMAVCHASTFPGPKVVPSTLPCRLEHADATVEMTQWADGSSREEFKTFSGGQSSTFIVREMLKGSETKKTKGLRQIWGESRAALMERPFDELTPLGGSFKFDARGGWTAIDAGYSPYHQGHTVVASPVVEILAALGLENSRPAKPDPKKRTFQYGLWQGSAPASLARAAIGCANVGMPIRLFQFELTLSSKGAKFVTFAQERSTQ